MPIDPQLPMQPSPPAADRDAVHALYRERLQSARQALAAQEARAARFHHFRLITFLLLLTATGFALWSDYVSALGGIALALVLLVAVIVAHERTLRRVVEARRRVQFANDCLDRMENRWAGRGVSGDAFRDDHHLYAGDLDLFGPGSLFELLCSARTALGEQRLASWLLAPASLEEVTRRQQAVRELIPRHALREDLAMLGPDVRAQVHPQALLAWGHREVERFPSGARLLGWLLPALTATAAVLVFVFQLPLSVLMLAVLLQLAFAGHLRARVQRVIAHVDFAARDLGILALVLQRFEQERFSSPALLALRQQLEAGGLPPSRRIAQLSRLGELLDSRLNMAFGMVAPALLWTTNCAMAMEAWRAENGRRMADWLEAVAQLEALSSLARYAFEHPTDTWPVFAGEEPVYEAEALAHPLLDERVAVRNTVTLGSFPQLLVVSGSNMSGKSTLLRAVGLSVVLAYAGAPVRAARLRLGRVHLGTSIRVSDNLQEGASRFYAEIRRIRDVLELAAAHRPALFLLDEIFSGTNSHDRRIGAQAILESLLQRGAIGLVTTHDLALTRLEGALHAKARNVHFEDHLENGEMRFDYRMQEGVVTRSNALELMRSIGIEL